MRKNETVIWKTMLLMVTLPFSLTAQNLILNGGFENWTSGNPDNWLTNNVPTLSTPITQSSTSHGGSSAARLEVVTLLGATNPPTLNAGNSGQGFPISARYGSLSGFYQFSPVSANDFLSVIVILDKGGEIIAAGVINIPNAASSYTEFTVPITYISPDIPEVARITIAIRDTIQGGFPALGASAFVDGLSFGGTVSVDNGKADRPSKKFALNQNYPNPFNPSTTFAFSIPQSAQVRLVVFNALGQSVAEVMNKRLPAGEHQVEWNGENLSSGVYFYRLYANDQVVTKKLILMK